MLADFIQALYQQFRDLYFTYLEINPLGKQISTNSHFRSYGSLLICDYLQISGVNDDILVCRSEHDFIQTFMTVSNKIDVNLVHLVV